MRTRENNDWLILNEIIYKIYTTEDIDEMRKNFLLQLKMVIDFDSADFYLSDDNQKMNNPITYNCDMPIAELYDEIDYSRGILYGGRSMVYRETDIITDENRTKTEYYQKVYKPNNWHYALQMIMARNKKFIGVVTLYRTIGKEDFKYDDVFILDMLKEHMSYRLDKEKTQLYHNMQVVKLGQVKEKYGLTLREEEIVGAVVGGKSNEEIAEEFVISLNTLKKHLMNIYRKMEINSKTQLLLIIKKE